MQNAVIAKKMRIFWEAELKYINILLDVKIRLKDMSHNA